MTKMQNKVVRTYNENFNIKMGYLIDELAKGWTVKSSNTFKKASGETWCIEYILEREAEDGR